jgi:hypothetical protein
MSASKRGNSGLRSLGAGGDANDQHRTAPRVSRQLLREVHMVVLLREALLDNWQSSLRLRIPAGSWVAWD